MFREKNPKVINIKTNLLGADLFTCLSKCQSSPVTPWPKLRCLRQPSRVSVTTQSRQRPLSFWKPSQKDSPNTLQGNREKACQKTLRNPFLHPAALSRSILHRLQTPGAPTQKTPRQLHSRAFRHARAVKASLLFHSVRQPQTGSALEAGNLSGKRRGAIQKEPSASAQTRKVNSAPFFQAKVGGACRPDNLGAFFHTTRLRLSRLLRSCFPQHGEQGKWVSR